MTDNLTPTNRSLMMAKVRDRNTQPEIKVRRIAHALGLRFRLHRKELAGSPDLVFPKYRVAIFVHGCFWHQHPGCSRATMPKSRTDFWSQKLARNVERDRRAISDLESRGWQVEVIWECETKKSNLLEERIRRIFSLKDIFSARRSVST
ncbi:very short patch repair endonuclease [Agrobacterium pusense]|uniref:very short patch repair endonuclease n=1 Tax=Agrobacterium pusense TaxID=648995 RepID=UPI00286CB3CD|nr:DNA mismatch endonuclease Vsr [Agrobacterium pusense]